tara:strand:+ start:853 stop:1227 length:375 start_codon:yes stop_codon:yes gene_type:complete
MENSIKFYEAIQNLKAGAEYTYVGDVPITEELFNQVNWKTGEDENQQIITTKVNPHSELTWSAVNTEMIRLQTEHDAQDYARKRKVAYPDIYDYMDGIVKDDQTQINKYIADSQAVKVRYPKGV